MESNKRLRMRSGLPMPFVFLTAPTWISNFACATAKKFQLSLNDNPA